MPSAAPSRCTDPSCGALATRRGRCDDHQRKAWANRSQHTDLMPRWEQARFRTAVLSRDQVCRMCHAAPAVEADHIIGVAEGGALNDVGNGQGLCSPCHLKKTLAERAARSKRPR